ncbi:MAG: FAD-dependent oxidoreductase [Chthoniobacter sp.]|uniref:FAD-dependent oxidoreductase n=1 Tax=Chthoniobacter sp. TaxID=2510640 RepID=UPI0032A4B49A
MFRFLPFVIAGWVLTGSLRAATLDADLLIVGGNESACAAAVQASRLGVQRIVLVNDIDWLGGQFSAEGVGVMDEWTTVDGKRADFPRSGLFREVAQRIEETNRRNYGTPSPGNSFCGRLTIEPAEAERIFEGLLAAESSHVRVERGWEPATVQLDGRRVTGVTFTRAAETLQVTARVTIDASDWGDVIQRSGAAWSAGPDARARFDEPSAPELVDDSNRREMNPITYCVTLRDAGKEALTAEPAGYDVRRYFGATKATVTEFKALPWPKGTLLMNVPAFADTAHTAGPYSSPVNVYTHRRLVDARHLHLAPGAEKTFLNWPTQDYPLDRWPKAVADALDAMEPGAAQKNLVALTPVQRRVVFADAKQHALGFFHYLQTVSPEFRGLELTDEYGTPDRLPPKPYVREGLRLEALTMLREQDIRTAHEEPRWAKLMPLDGVFGFQFNIDFHPTRRVFLNDDPAGPWATIHTATRNWSTHTDRAMFPLRGLVPIERDGLLGASKNIGVSSVVQSALRLHGQMMLCGQASATVAWLALRDGVQPRAVAADPQRVLAVQRALVKSGVLIWPFHDLDPTADYFEAVNLLAVRGVIVPDADSVRFQPDKIASAEEIAGVLARAKLAELPGRNPAQPLTRAALATAVWAALAH